MKRTYRSSLLAAVLLLLTSGVVPAQAQQARPDKIFLTSGEAIEVVVVEVLPDAVKYRTWRNRTGPVYTLPKRDVHMVLYANGEHEPYGAARQASSDRRTRSVVPTAAAGGASTGGAPLGFNHLGMGFPGTEGADAFAWGFGYSTTKLVGAYEQIRYGYGYEFTQNYMTATLAPGSSMWSGAWWLGPRAYADYAFSEDIVAYGGLGVGLVLARASGEMIGSTTSTDVDAFLMVGAAYYLTEQWGVLLEIRPWSGPADLTFGVTRRGLFKNWWRGVN